MAANVRLNMTGDQRKLARELAKSEANMDKLKDKLKKVGNVGAATGRQLEKGFGGKTLGNLKNYALGVASIGTAIGTLSGAYQIWIRNIKETAEATGKAANELIAFAALQAGGTKANRVKSATRLAQRFGVLNRGEAFNTVQALQSALGGDFRKGLKASETVFAASRVGIPVELGRELAVQGIGQGQSGADFIRQAFVAGQESARDPKEIASAAAALQLFKNKRFGFAAAGVLASPFAGKLETFLQAAGIGLSKVSSAGFQRTFRRLGVADASKSEKLRALAKAGIDTQEKLAQAGLTEIRQQRAIAALITKLPEVERIAGAISQRAKPGLFVSQRRAIESELPNVRLRGQIREATIRGRDLQAFGPLAVDAQREVLLSRDRANALRAVGIESGVLGGDVIDPEGRTSPFQFLSARLRATPRQLRLITADIAIQQAQRKLRGGERFSRADIRGLRQTRRQLFRNPLSNAFVVPAGVPAELTPSQQTPLERSMAETLKDILDELKQNTAELRTIRDKSPAGAALVPATEDTPPGA